MLSKSQARRVAIQARAMDPVTFSYELPLGIQANTFVTVEQVAVLRKQFSNGDRVPSWLQLLWLGAPDRRAV